MIFLWSFRQAQLTRALGDQCTLLLLLFAMGAQKGPLVCCRKQLWWLAWLPIQRFRKRIVSPPSGFSGPLSTQSKAAVKYYCGGVCELSGMGCTSCPQGLQFKVRIREVMCACLVRKVTGLQAKWVCIPSNGHSALGKSVVVIIHPT